MPSHAQALWIGLNPLKVCWGRYRTPPASMSAASRGPGALSSRGSSRGCCGRLCHLRRAGHGPRGPRAMPAAPAWGRIGSGLSAFMAIQGAKPAGHGPRGPLGPVGCDGADWTHDWTAPPAGGAHAAHSAEDRCCHRYGHHPRRRDQSRNPVSSELGIHAYCTLHSVRNV